MYRKQMLTPLERALDVINKVVEKDDEPAHRLVAAKCRGLMVGYDIRWHDADWQAVSLEEEYELPLINPNTGRRSRNWTQAGKFDGIIERDSRSYLLEHKTTSEDISDPNAPYWRRLVIDSQVSGYVLANWQSGRKLAGTVYDVIKKPGIRPKNISKADQKVLRTEGTYCGFQVDELQRGLECEDYDLYALRLVRDTFDNPEKYFQRRSVPRLDDEIVEHAAEMWDIAKAIQEASRTQRHYRNSSACMQYGTPCEYLGLCSRHDTPNSDRWVRAERVHSELPQLDGDGRSVLTNSRVKCFQTCRQKHYLRYELGLRRTDEDQREALFFGDLFHRALEAWWSSFLIPERDNDGNDGNSASAVDRSSTDSGLGEASQEEWPRASEPTAAPRG